MLPRGMARHAVVRAISRSPRLIRLDAATCASAVPSVRGRPSVGWFRNGVVPKAARLVSRFFHAVRRFGAALPGSMVRVMRLTLVWTAPFRGLRCRSGTREEGGRLCERPILSAVSGSCS